MPRLTDPFQVKGLYLRNRLVMAPMVTGLAVDHAPSEAQLAWYHDRARAGVALVVVEATAIASDGKLMPGMLGIWDDAQVAGLAQLAHSIQSAGVSAVLQIVHGGARSWREDLAQERIGPSPVPLMPGPAPRAMRETEIESVIAAFAAAARRAQAAGFDGVEIHAAHYYLVSEFLSPYANRRADRWGGDRAGRARLAVEVTRAVRRAVGPEYPLFCRMHAVEFVEGGTSPEDTLYFARAFEEAGVDLIDASGISQSSLGEWQGQPFLNTSSVLPKGAPAGKFAPFAGLLRAAVSVPVIAVGKMGEPGLAQRALDQGHADLVALARQLIADPQSAQKILAGRPDKVRRCQECLACFAAIRKGPVRCAVNQTL